MQKTLSTCWNVKKLLLWHALAACVLASFFLPWGKSLWDLIDIKTFSTLNQTLEVNRFAQFFWGFFNHENADWLEDVIIFLFFFTLFKRAPVELKSRKIAEFLFCLLYTGLILFLVNHLFFAKILHLHRESPSVVLNDVIHLSEKLPWMKLKSGSTRCFPGDHATTALFFAICYAFYAPRRLAIFASLYTLLLSLPRVVMGAHWMTDIIVGSGSIAMVSLSWAFCTPFHLHATNLIEAMLKKTRRVERIG
jgi:Kdo2-lipid A phosphotransferase